MDIFSVRCPACKRDYYADMLLYSLKVELHCPFCGVYFYKEQSPQLVTGGVAASTVARVAGGLTEDMIYRPPSPEE